MKNIKDFIIESINKSSEKNISYKDLIKEYKDSISEDEIKEIETMLSKYSKNKFIEVESDLYYKLLEIAPEHSDPDDEMCENIVEIGEENWAAIFNYKNKLYYLDFAVNLDNPKIYLIK